MELCAPAANLSLYFGSGLASARFLLPHFAEVLLQLLFKAVDLCGLHVLVYEFGLFLLRFDHCSELGLGRGLQAIELGLAFVQSHFLVHFSGVKLAHFLLEVGDESRLQGQGLVKFFAELL